MTTLAESPALLAPLALTFVSAAVVGRARINRRRQALNRALHELRRPLQALALGAAGDRADPQVRAAIDALADLDREINGGGQPEARRRRVEARELAREAVERWRRPALRLGRTIELRWRAPSCPIECELEAISRALDNLIANSLEHGSGPIVLEGTSRPGRVRINVADRGLPPPQTAPPPRRPGRDPRRGHGIALVAAAASRHGGRFASCRGPQGASAVIELPLAQ